MITSKYAKGVLITTIIAIVLFAIPTLISIPTMFLARDVAKDIAGSGYGDVVDAVVDFVVFILVALLIVGVFAIISGFMLSLKGKWCLGCIVLSIILAAYEVIGLFSSFGDNGSVGAVLLALANGANFTVMAVMAIKAKSEIY